MTRSKARKQQKQRKPKKELSLTHPPEVRYSIMRTHVLRFAVNTSAVGKIFTAQNILDSICIATTAIAPFQLYDSFKIKRVSVWGFFSGNVTTVSVGFINPTTGDNEIHTDTSLGMSRPACVHARPSSKSLASFWQNTSTNAVFGITCATQSIVDIQVAFRDVPGVATACQNASVGATVGAVYYRGLDGLAIAASTFPPPAGINAI